MTVNENQQRHMDDEEIQDGELREALVMQLRRWRENQEAEERWAEAHKGVNRAKKKIKELLGVHLDGNPHRFILDDCIIEITAVRPGGHREFDASDRQDVKVQRADE